MSEPIIVRAVAFQEGEFWVVQGIEYDIATHAKDPADVPLAFMRAVVENACICEQLGREPLKGLKPAPSRFLEMYESAEAEVRPVRRTPSQPEVDIRLVAA